MKLTDQGIRRAASSRERFPDSFAPGVTSGDFSRTSLNASRMTNDAIAREEANYVNNRAVYLYIDAGACCVGVASLIVLEYFAERL